MFHAREFTLSTGGISFAKIGRNYQPQHRIAEKFQCFIVELTSLVLGSGGNLFMGPGTMGDSAFQQRPIFKLVTENGFQEVKIRKFNSLFFQGRFIENKPEASSDRATKLPAVNQES